MDPDANLKEQLEIAKWLHDTSPEEASYDQVLEKADRIAQLVLELDKHLREGGALPKSWTRPRCTHCRIPGVITPPGSTPREKQRCTLKKGHDPSIPHAYGSWDWSDFPGGVPPKRGWRDADEEPR